MFDPHHNFFAVKTSVLSAEVLELPVCLRDNGQVPRLQLEFLECGQKVTSILKPEGPHELVAFLPESRYLQTDELEDCPLLVRMREGWEKLKKGRVGFGNPLQELAETFSAPDLDGLNEFFAMTHFLLLEVMPRADKLKGLYMDMRNLLGYLSPAGLVMPSIHADPKVDQIPHHLDRMSNNWRVGYPLARVVQLAEIEEPILGLLRFALNQPKLTLKWCEAPESLVDMRREAVSTWQAHFGNMWGPFQ